MAETTYTFMPWLRQGLAAGIDVTDNLGGPSVQPERASINVSFKVGTESISKQAHLLGPGDVVGINPRAIVKTEPRHWVTDFEASVIVTRKFQRVRGSNGEVFTWIGRRKETGRGEGASGLLFDQVVPLKQK